MFPLVVFADCLSLSPAQCLFVKVTHDGAVCFHSLSLQTVSHSRLLNDLLQISTRNAAVYNRHGKL